MKLSNKDKDLLKTALDVFNNTHSYDDEVCDEIEEVLLNNDGSGVLGLLIDCKNLLDNTHCYDMDIFHEISDRISELRS